MERRQARLRARLAPVLVPLLQEQLELLAHPMVLAMGRLDDRQQETLLVSRQVFQVTEQLQVHQPMAEVKELLLEILASLQPTVEEQLSPLIGQPLPPISRLASES